MPLIRKLCPRCQSEFFIKQSLAARGRGKFCSLKCSVRTFVQSNTQHKPLEVGDRFHMLTLIEPIGAGRNPTWRVKCDCGVEKVTRASRFRGLRPLLSCGCYRLPRVGDPNAVTRHPLYRIWCNMRTRGNNQNDPLYGGRGIRVCTRWEKGEDGNTGFECFVHDMGARPSKKHSIDRIDNDGDYCPSNCRWATNKEQSRNRRQNILVEVEGEKMCLLDAVEKLKPKNSYATVLSRLSKGWDLHEALYQPKQPGKPLRNRA